MNRKHLLLLALAVLLPNGLAIAEEPAPAKTYEVRSMRDLAYYDGEGADKVKHKLDLYLPRDLKKFPVLFFVHGGAWTSGDKNYFGVYTALAQNFARHGVGTVVTNYRLSPGVKHPEHIKDIARAFAWTYKNIAAHGGDPAHLFVCGHSAGGHLVALLATDESYLKAEGLTLKAIRGAVPMSGVFSVPEKLLPKVFGDDPELRKKASPLNHVRAGLPPFLVIYADNDLSLCSKTSVEFAKALEEKKCPVQKLEVGKRNHFSLILQANVDGDAATEAILRFIAKQPGS